MRYRNIDPQLFITNRKKLISYLHPNSLVVLQANDSMPKNTDATMPFVQHSDLFYLSGIDQEETILLLYPDAIKSEWKEILFIKETNEMVEIWEGKKYTKEAARDRSGIEIIHWISAFEPLLHTLMGLAEQLYLSSNEHPRANCPVESRNGRFIRWVKEHYPLHRYERIAPIMQKLRSIKEPIELSLLQEACRITEAGFRSVLSIIQPGLMEYEAEALLAYEFIRRGSRGFAFEPIIASGANSCILHYHQNNQPCPAEGLLLLDIGAEYANYSADVTRVVPITGVFTARQRQVYASVLHILKTAQALITAGLSFLDYHKEIIAWVEHELLALRLIDRTDLKTQTQKAPAYKKYFMHGISHHLGLSTHDVGDTHGIMQANMVLTVEPGIYIPKEGIGIRLEDDIVVCHNGIRNLTEDIPIEVEEIETLMRQGKQL
ncbi:MAG: aminopeptidase P N-terminal domain-containing protein [Candidatus Cardinium sp.]|nr:aminopeptidase P N-terminal domain-containing protein [Candidatus Cardinium sp.]